MMMSATAQMALLAVPCPSSAIVALHFLLVPPYAHRYRETVCQRTTPTEAAEADLGTTAVAAVTRNLDDVLTVDLATMVTAILRVSGCIASASLVRALSFVCHKDLLRKI
jgi:hypothetical protein